MSEHTASTSVPTGPDDVYAYLADVSHLPDYFPMMTSAERVPGEDAVRTTAVLDPEATGGDADDEPREVQGEAWFRTDDEARSIEWGSEGDNDYRGRLRVSPDGDGSRIELMIHSRREHEGMDESLQESLASIARHAAAAG